jgi:Holliday junction resolvase RusA-like endonuclease
MKKREKKVPQRVHIKLGRVCIGVRTPKCRSLPHSPNYLNGKHWAIRAAWKDAWKEEVWAQWNTVKQNYKGVELPFKKAKLEIFVFYSGISQDMDNLYASLKPIIDALTDNGIIPDDSKEFLLIGPIQYIKCAKNAEHLELDITLRK